jgi:hypothetical protein
VPDPQPEKESAMDIRTVTRNVDLVYSPDDGGWYFDDVHSDRTSIVYSSESDARRAWSDGIVEWDATVSR